MILLLGNKIDVDTPFDDFDNQIRLTCAEHRVKYHGISAKTGENVNEALEEAIRLHEIKKNAGTKSSDPNVVKVDRQDQHRREFDDYDSCCSQ